VLESYNVGDEYLEQSFTPPFEREVVKIARILDVNLEGVRKVIVSFVRDPLTAANCIRKSQASLEDASRAANQPELFDV